MGCICEKEKIEKGIFICPVCLRKSGYDKWQKKGNKWIFHKDGAWFCFHDFSFITAEQCWEETKGATAEMWNKGGWVCNICKYNAKNFSDYIPDYPRTEKEKLEFEKRKNDFLNGELLNNKIDNMVLAKKVNYLQSLLNEKQEENDILNDQLDEMEYQNEADQIAVKIESLDRTVNIMIPCKTTDKFVKIEEKILQNYPKYKNRKYYFSINGKVIQRYKTLEENNIKSSDIILFNAI